MQREILSGLGLVFVQVNERPVIRLDSNDHGECERYAKKVTQIVEQFGPNYTGLMSADRFFTGRAGELGFRYWCDQNDILYEETINDEGVPDAQDFILTLKTGEPVSINVKNSLHLRARYLMQPADQAAKHKQDIYVAATGEDYGRNNGIDIKLWGWVSRREFSALAQTVKRKIVTKQLLLEEMPHNMNDLAELVMTKLDQNFDIPI